MSSSVKVGQQEQVFVWLIVKSARLTSAFPLSLNGQVAACVVQVSETEIKTLKDGFTNATTFQMNGVTVGGTKYMYLQSDDCQIQAKKGATGVSVAKAGKCKFKQKSQLSLQCASKNVRPYLQYIRYFSVNIRTVAYVILPYVFCMLISLYDKKTSYLQPQFKQESCAIAKMTARCALYKQIVSCCGDNPFEIIQDGGGRHLEFVRSKIAPLDPPSPKTSPYNQT